MHNHKKMCKKVVKSIAFIAFGIALVGFIKGATIGYLIGKHKAKHDWHKIKVTDNSDKQEKER